MIVSLSQLRLLYQNTTVWGRRLFLGSGGWEVWDGGAGAVTCWWELSSWFERGRRRLAADTASYVLTERRGGSSGVSSNSCKDSDLIMRVSPSGPYLTLNFPKSPLPNTFTSGVWALTYELGVGVGNTIQSIAVGQVLGLILLASFWEVFTFSAGTLFSPKFSVS